MLKEKIDEFYVKQHEDRDKTHFYITDAGKCPRAVYFQFKKLPKKGPDARALRIMDHGDYTHLRIISTLFAMGVVKATEIDIPNKEIVHGRVDVIVNIDGEPCVVEIKSINASAFANLHEGNPDHVKQLQCYLHYFNIKKGVLIYENKNTQELKEFILEYDAELVRKVLEEFLILKAQIENNVVPGTAGVEEWRCTYCPYAEECKKY